MRSSTRVRRQASRLDTLMTNVLDTVDRASNFMADAVAKPMRQFSAILASVKAAIESLRTYGACAPLRPVSAPAITICSFSLVLRL